MEKPRLIRTKTSAKERRELENRRKLVMYVEQGDANRIVKELNAVQRRWTYFWDESPTQREKVDRVGLFKIPNEPQEQNGGVRIE